MQEITRILVDVARDELPEGHGTEISVSARAKRANRSPLPASRFATAGSIDGFAFAWRNFASSIETPHCSIILCSAAIITECCMRPL